jgi:pimeloyl-ACP methyl ester carboxylesterase
MMAQAFDRTDTTHTVSVDGLPVAYATTGAGSPVVCLVHGTGGSGDVWVRQLEGLADIGRIVALDLPGHGRSGGAVPRRIEDAAALVVRFLDAQGIGRVVLGGHSMGGAVAQHVALACPERLDGLVLIGTGARLRVLPRLLDLLANDPPHGVDLLMSLALGAKAPDELRGKLHRSLVLNPPGVILGDLQACDAFDVMDRIATVRAPTLALCGEEDRLTPPRYSRFFGQRIAGASVIIVPGAGHYVQLEKPDETTAALREFLGASGRARVRAPA